MKRYIIFAADGVVEFGARGIKASFDDIKKAEEWLDRFIRQTKHRRARAEVFDTEDCMRSVYRFWKGSNREIRL